MFEYYLCKYYEVPQKFLFIGETLLLLKNTSTLGGYVVSDSNYY